MSACGFVVLAAAGEPEAALADWARPDVREEVALAGADLVRLAAGFAVLLAGALPEGAFAFVPELAVEPPAACLRLARNPPLGAPSFGLATAASPAAALAAAMPSLPP